MGPILEGLETGAPYRFPLRECALLELTNMKYLKPVVAEIPAAAKDIFTLDYDLSTSIAITVIGFAPAAAVILWHAI